MAHPPTPPPRPPIPGSSFQHPTGTLGTNANGDGLCDHEDVVVCLDEAEDGKRDNRLGRKAKFRADIGVGLLRRKEEDD